MVDRHVVRARIGKIREYVALLRKIRRLADEARFVKDPLIHGNAERYLQLAIQGVLDISNHVVADMGLSLPNDNQDMFDLLARRKIVSSGRCKGGALVGGRGDAPSPRPFALPAPDETPRCGWTIGPGSIRAGGQTMA